MFHDDLLNQNLLRVSAQHPGERLLHELESTLPRLDRLLSGTTSTVLVRDLLPDRYTITLSAIYFVRCYAVPCSRRQASSLFISCGGVARRDFRSDGKRQNRLVLNATTVTLPRTCEEAIFRVEFVWRRGEGSRFSRAFTLKPICCVSGYTSDRDSGRKIQSAKTPAHTPNTTPTPPPTAPPQKKNPPSRRRD